MSRWVEWVLIALILAGIAIGLTVGLLVVARDLASVDYENEGGYWSRGDWDAYLWRANPSLRIRWSSGGEHLVFATHFVTAPYRGSGQGYLYVLKADGSSVQRLTSSSTRYELDVHPDVSPDGTRLVVATSRHRTEMHGLPRTFEIQTSGLDGSNPKRLTDDLYLNTAPSWSPDGARIAFLRNSFRIYGKDVEGIYTMASDGSDQRRLTILQDRAAVPGEVQFPRNHSAGPVWSPDGQLLAYALHEPTVAVVEIADLRAASDERGNLHPGGLEGMISAGQVGEHRWKGRGQRNILYTVGADGSAKTKVTTAVTLVALQGNSRPMSPPSWSPDGQRLAFSSDDWKEPGVYLVRPDGSDLRKVSDEFARSVSWSPDGSELLVAADGVSVIQVDGSGKRELLNEPGELPMLAAWSPDGTRIVVVAKTATVRTREYPYHQFDLVVSTMDSDGSHRRVLARSGPTWELVAENPPRGR